MSGRRVAEWWLGVLGTPSELVGDLAELAARRSAWWYWRQIAATTMALTHRSARRQPWHWARCTAAGMASLLLLTTLLSRSTVGPADALDVRVEASGWLPLPSPDGRVRVIPMVVVRVANQTGHRLAGVQLNVVFRRASDGTEWDSVWQPHIGGARLAAGAQVESLVFVSQHGHVGVSPPAGLLDHPGFVDARVELFAKYAAQHWSRLAVHQVDRRLAQLRTTADSSTYTKVARIETATDLDARLGPARPGQQRGTSPVGRLRHAEINGGDIGRVGNVRPRS